MNPGGTRDQTGHASRPRSTKVTPKRIATQRRRRDALVLRDQGLTYQKIADRLGYSSAGEARKQVMIAFADVVQEPAQDVLTLQIERFNSLLVTAWTAAHDPTASTAARLRAVRSAIDIIDQIGYLAGLVPAPHRNPTKRRAPRFTIPLLPTVTSV